MRPRSTSAPTSITCPAIWCPGMIGQAGGSRSPSRMWRSVRQTAHARTEPPGPSMSHARTSLSLAGLRASQLRHAPAAAERDQRVAVGVGVRAPARGPALLAAAGVAFPVGRDADAVEDVAMGAVQAG